VISTLQGSYSTIGDTGGLHSRGRWLSLDWKYLLWRASVCFLGQDASLQHACVQSLDSRLTSPNAQKPSAGV
jgi:hypothetical protein